MSKSTFVYYGDCNLVIECRNGKHRLVPRCVAENEDKLANYNETWCDQLQPCFYADNGNVWMGITDEVEVEFNITPGIYKLTRIENAKENND